MPYSLERKLVVGVSSRAIFKLDEAHNIFSSEGVDAYRKHQIERVDKPLEKGVAFPFIKRLLNLNNEYPQEKPIEVIVLSRNDPETGKRFYNSCAHHGLNITRGAFLAGSSPFPYMKSFNCCLFLSADEENVKNAVKEGLPAGLILPSEFVDKDPDNQLRLAFDFDGVLADDESEKVYKEKNDLSQFHQNEVEKTNIPHGPGPLLGLIKKITLFQKLELKKHEKNNSHKPLIRIAVVTARNAPSHDRFVTTLKEWDIKPDETFFLGGVEKKKVLDIFKPHIFFDDQLEHLAPTAPTIPSVHIPFGVANK